MEKGLTFTSKDTVRVENLAKTVGSGDLEVLATPAMAALMENAAMRAVAPELPDGSTTVGAMLQLTHTRPSGMGETFTATAVLEEVDGRKLTFSLVASDSKGVIGEGKHVRYIVDRQKFMSKL
ncbi:thioesterase family protein [uncultured Parabacteroides sp.]|uniref:thioesterase family protein n=1 Tax=uncultured Parabacteroides sp. TaxID=512312 RepID=UPI00262D1D9D|nr:thioesterase family protein [uncultured Parabacteroides sp.]